LTYKNAELLQLWLEASVFSQHFIQPIYLEPLQKANRRTTSSYSNVLLIDLHQQFTAEMLLKANVLSPLALVVVSAFAFLNTDSQTKLPVGRNCVFLSTDWLCYLLSISVEYRTHSVCKGFGLQSCSIAPKPTDLFCLPLRLCASITTTSVHFPIHLQNPILLFFVCHTLTFLVQEYPHTINCVVMVLLEVLGIWLHCSLTVYMSNHRQNSEQLFLQSAVFHSLLEYCSA
jgi:hypothetical protein